VDSAKKLSLREQNIARSKGAKAKSAGQPPHTKTKTLSDGTKLNVTFHNANKRPHRFVYEDEATPGDKALRCKVCGMARTNKKVHPTVVESR
jgi:hypothetical protein